jgi:hypothetical protein
MRGYFKKLNLNLDILGINTNPEKLRDHSKYISWQKYGIAYKRKNEFTPATNESLHLDDSDKQKIIDQLPKGLLEIEIPDVWLLNAQAPKYEGKVMLPPHTDGVRLCSINIYYETHGEKTAYYDYVSGKEINETCSFVAQVGDCYLLNSDKPHSVEVIGNPRRSISVSFITTPYDIIESFFINN